jgi:hypothetical protein
MHEGRNKIYELTFSRALNKRTAKMNFLEEKIILLLCLSHAMACGRERMEKLLFHRY